MKKKSYFLQMIWKFLFISTKSLIQSTLNVKDKYSNFFSVKLTFKKIKNTFIYFNTNYHTEMKLVPIIMDYCLLKFDALKFFFGMRIQGESLPNFNFFKANPQIFQQNLEVHLWNCLETDFHNISNSSLWVIRRRNYS